MHLDADGDVKVLVQGDLWTFNPMCLTTSSGLSREKVLLLCMLNYFKYFLLIYGKSTICSIHIHCRVCVTNRCFSIQYKFC